MSEQKNKWCWFQSVRKNGEPLYFGFVELNGVQKHLSLVTKPTYSPADTYNNATLMNCVSDIAKTKAINILSNLGWQNCEVFNG